MGKQLLSLVRELKIKKAADVILPCSISRDEEHGRRNENSRYNLEIHSCEIKCGGYEREKRKDENKRSRDEGGREFVSFIRIFRKFLERVSHNVYSFENKCVR